MLTPHRLMNLNYCVLNVASLIVKCLIERGSYHLDGILKYCRAENTEINEQDITLAVSFLYLLNKVKYEKDEDLVCLISECND
jgi:hypothetical protein